MTAQHAVSRQIPGVQADVINAQSRAPRGAAARAASAQRATSPPSSARRPWRERAFVSYAGRSVHRSDAPGPSPIKQRRPRKVAGIGAAAEQAKRFLDLGDALDALVRAIAAADALAAGLSRRVHGLWQGDAAAVVEWQATELRSEARLVLAADVQRGRFILPAYAAGLRLVSLREQSVPEDVLRLCRQLGELERGALSVTAFADWLWRGGACGFDVAQVASVGELGRALPAEERPAAELWSERSEQAVALWNDLAWAAAQALDPIALAQRFAPPLEQLVLRVRAGDLALGMPEAQALRARADNPAAWARAELTLLGKRPELNAALPRAHVTFPLQSSIESAGRFELGLLETIEQLSGGAGDSDVIDLGLLGAAFGRALLARGFDPDELRAFVDRAPAALCEGFLPVLLEPQRGATHGRDALSVLLWHWGAERFFARVSPKQFGAELAVALFAAALAVGCDAAQLGRALEQLPIDAALRAAAAHPQLLRKAGAVIERRIHANPPHSGPLLAELAASSVGAARLVGGVVLARQASGFGPEALKAALRAVARAGCGAEFVLPLWEARTNAAHVRLAALYALESDKPLLAPILGRRVANMLEPAEIRAALDELRARVA
jgi:hypothetical protein